MYELIILNSYSIFQILNSIFLFIIGTAVGSFLNVLIDRWSNDQPITGRSHCDFCKKQLKSIDLIPIFSFLFLCGRSRCCNKKLSWQYPIVELVTGIILFGIWNMEFGIWNGNKGMQNVELISKFFILNSSSIFQILNSIFLFGIITCLIVVFFADVKYQIIPDQIQIILLIIGFILQVSYMLLAGCNNGQLLNCYIVKLLSFVVAGVVVMIPILLIYLISRGRAMGFGDVKLAFNMGILLGAKGGLLALYFAFILGGIFGAYLLLSKKKKLKSKIAFGPFLVLGTLILLFFTPQIYLWLKQTYGF